VVPPYRVLWKTEPATGSYLHRRPGVAGPAACGGGFTELHNLPRTASYVHGVPYRVLRSIPVLGRDHYHARASGVGPPGAVLIAKAMIQAAVGTSVPVWPD
jgi:hypothetical protein